MTKHLMTAAKYLVNTLIRVNTPQRRIEMNRKIMSGDDYEFQTSLVEVFKNSVLRCFFAVPLAA